MKDLGASGMTATVLSSTPTCAVTVNPTPASAGSSAAHEATLLALGSLTSYSSAEATSATLPLLQDPRARNGSSPASRHTLGMTESDASVEALARWVERSGLRFSGVIPLEAVATVAAVEAATAGGDSDVVRACLWLGEHRSVLAVGAPNHLRFVRLVGLGSESIAEALTRVSSLPGSHQGMIPLALDDARGLLFRCGIPRPSDVVDKESNLTGTTILPLLQPVLQRLSLEVKQSLRFGLSETERATAGLGLLGPGAYIPNLESMLAAHLASADNRSPSAHESGFNARSIEGEYTSAMSGEIAAALEMGRQVPMLTPKAWQQSESERRIRWSLRGGVAACLAIVLVEGGISWIELRELKKGAGGPEQIASGVIDPHAFAPIRERASALLARVDSRVSAPIMLDAVQATISQAAEDRVLLESISFGPANSGPEMSLRGIAVGAASSEAPANLRAFLDALAQCPLVQAARLKHSQRSQRDGAEVQAFEVVVSFVPPAPDRPVGLDMTSAHAGRSEP